MINKFVLVVSLVTWLDEHGWQQAYQVEEQKDLTKEVPHSKLGEGDDDDEEISSHQALNMFKQMDLKGRVSKPSAGGKPGL